MFIKHSNHKIVILIMFADDIIVKGNDTEKISNLKRHLAKEFEIKDLKILDTFLGLK